MLQRKNKKADTFTQQQFIENLTVNVEEKINSSKRLALSSPGRPIACYYNGYSIKYLELLSQAVEKEKVALITVRKTGMHANRGSFAVPHLCYPKIPSTTKKNFRPGLPCLLWEESNECLTYIIRTSDALARNYTVRDLRETKRADFLFPQQRKAKKTVIEKPISCLISMRSFYTTLQILKNVLLCKNGHIIYVFDNKSASFHPSLLEYNVAEEILLSFNFYSDNKDFYQAKSSASTIRVLYDLETVLCGVGACRCCVLRQREVNHAICQHGLMQVCK